MDWYLTAAADAVATTTAVAGGPAPEPDLAREPSARSSGARHSAPGGDPRRLDLAIARVIEQQAESVLAGVQVAALYDAGDPLGYGAVLPGGCPSWLAADLDLLVQMVRLSAAAGVVLAHGVAGAPPVSLTDPGAHLAASRACYREVIDVLSRMSIADEVSTGCRDEALRLLRQVERRVHHLDETHPGMAERPVTRSAGGYEREREYIPGELLG
ncbi:MAG TPA: hypothetical protein VFP72_00945 [Kineosporiaceae bacterium]|nr:hypothetical protein [Kineosporiaceae bacterium]